MPTKVSFPLAKTKNQINETILDEPQNKQATTILQYRTLLETTRNKQAR